MPQVLLGLRSSGHITHKSTQELRGQQQAAGLLVRERRGHPDQTLGGQPPT